VTRNEILEHRGALLLATSLVAVVLALAIYWPSLHGPFVSDDALFIVLNPWTSTLSLESVAEMFRPFGEARTASNYAPLHLLASAVERRMFGDELFGYHVVNIFIHAVNATLLIALLLSSRLPRVLAIFGGLIFLVHPANVEAVAWISQLKTNASLALALGAVLAFRRNPGVATALFLAGLLTKASAAAALPMAAALAWSEAGQDGASGQEDWGRAPWRWLAIWLLLLVVFAVPHFGAIHPRGTIEVPAYVDLCVHLRTIASIGTHYLVMAYTGLGVAYGQEYPPVMSAVDPGWIAALPLAGFFLWRIAVSLRGKSQEAVYWIGAAAGFVPISQMLPFLHPTADRYLYFILPGLIGGSLLLLNRVWKARLDAMDLGHAARSRGFRYAAIAVGLAVVALFGARSWERAHLWSDRELLMSDSARQFPEGRTAVFLRARQAASTGDAATSVALLRRAIELGGDQLQFDPAFRPIANDPVFRVLSRELASQHIARMASFGRLMQRELSTLAAAHFDRGEFRQAERALEEAIRRGGIMRLQLESELDWVRRTRERIKGGSAIF
jgi:hypothetical protein